MDALPPYYYSRWLRFYCPSQSFAPFAGSIVHFHVSFHHCILQINHPFMSFAYCEKSSRLKCRKALQVRSLTVYHHHRLAVLTLPHPHPSCTIWHHFSFPGWFALFFLFAPACSIHLCYCIPPRFTNRQKFSRPTRLPDRVGGGGA